MEIAGQFLKVAIKWMINSQLYVWHMLWIRFLHAFFIFINSSAGQALHRAGHMGACVPLNGSFFMSDIFTFEMEQTEKK